MNFAKLAAVALLPSITMVAQLLFRSALDDREMKFEPGALFRLATHPHLIMGVAMQGLGFVFWLWIISKLKLAEAFGMVGGVFYIVVAVVSYFALDESLRPLQIIGLITISLGVTALALG